MAKQKNSKDKAKDLQTPMLVKKKEKEILKDLIGKYLSSPTLPLDLIKKEDLEEESRKFLKEFVIAVSFGEMEDIHTPQFKPVIQCLRDFSRKCAQLGFTPSETTSYLFFLREILLGFITREFRSQPEIINQEVIITSQLLDKLGMITFETYVREREELITEQKESLLKMTTPLMVLWKDILLLPVVGTVDSKRAQLLMEINLNKIAETESKVVILDILGVPAVDTLVVNHILKVTKATKLMGCDCILSGISPKVAQTIVQSGLDVGDVITKATLRDALEYAFHLIGVEAQEVKVKR